MNKSGFNLYKALIKPLREMDDTQQLRRYLIGPQAEFDRGEAAILSLPDQIKPDKVRSDLLQYLMPLIGFTTELRSITDRLTTDQLRRLVTVAVPLWNQRHTRAGIVNGIRLLTGRTALVSDWFSYRALLGEVSLTEDQLVQGGDFWIIGGSISLYDEYWSNIRLMDDGMLDELLLLDVCKLMRPLDERFEIFIDDFLDHFDGTLDKWTNLGGGTIADNGAINTTTYPGTLSLFHQLSPLVPLWTSLATKHDYNLACKFLMPSAGGLLSIKWYVPSPGSGTNYELQLDPATGLGKLLRSGVIIQAAVLWPVSCQFVVGVWYSLRIFVSNLNSTIRSIRVFIDGNQAVPSSPSSTELIDAPGADPHVGDIVFENLGTGAIQLDNVEIWRNPARFATIAVSTITARGGEVTMSSNFIQ